MHEADQNLLTGTHSSLSRLLSHTPAPRPSPSDISLARSAVESDLPSRQRSLEETQSHLETLSKGFDGSSLSPRYYGFVTGGVTPAARLGDLFASTYDQNGQIHLPNDNIVTEVEAAALRMLTQLLRLEEQTWVHRAMTTGATASNILSLAAAREMLLENALRQKGLERAAGEGTLSMARRADVDDIQVLACAPHSSLGKACNVVGIGSASMVDICAGGQSSATTFVTVDFQKLEDQLRRRRILHIVALACGEVNTGYSNTSLATLTRIRSLTNKHGGWIHIDAAFGGFMRALPSTPSFARLHEAASGLDLADSLTIDGHKLLNVPYDAGFFLCRHSVTVGSNTGAAYLTPVPGKVPSPLNMHLENSARFRSLAVYATLTTYGRDGYAAILERMVLLARRVAGFLSTSDAFELLPQEVVDDSDFADMFMVVLFRAKDPLLNEALVERINETREIYVSGTMWDGCKAARIAIAKWDVDVERDFTIISRVLDGVSASQKSRLE